MSEREHLFLIDGSGYIFRAYHALPPLSRPDGTPVGAVYGFCNMLYKLLEDSGSEAPTHLAVIFDAGRLTFRNTLYPAYKANRPEPPEDLIPQFALIRDAVRAFDVPCIELADYEADDIIATYARQARERGATVIIVSSDKDLMQLVDDDVLLLDTMKNKKLGIAEVIEKFGVPPEKVIDVQSLAGDSVDNVPGVPGIGIKTAAQLINEYGDLDALLARAGEIKQPKRRESLINYADQARISRDLVRLHDTVPVPETIDDLKVRPIDVPRAIAFVEENGFRTLATKLAARHQREAPAAASSAAQAAAEARPRVEMGGYDTILSLEALDAWIDAAASQGFVAVDTETTSLQPMLAELVGVSLAIEPGKACYIPIGHTGSGGDGTLDLDGDRPAQLPKAQVLARLKPLLEDPGVLKIGQNIKYDTVVLARCGIQVGPVDDTMLISYALEGGLHGHGMDELSELHLGHKPIAFKDVAGSGKNQVTFDRVPLDKATAYAAEDADVTLRLHEVLKPRLTQEHLVTVYETLERPLSPVLAAMEQEGIKVDRERLAALSREFADGMAAFETEIYRLAGREFNIGSPKQLGEILFDEMNLGSTRTGKSGARSTGADILEDLAAQGHDLPARVLDWRQLSKLKSTYTDSLQQQIDPVTGRVHTCFAMASTTTGRLSSTDPNLQNIPIRSPEGRKIRQAFIPESGHRLMSADYSQIELRILAHMADIPALKQAFADGLDIHAMTASEVLGIPIDGMPPEQRRRAKAINFGIIYGISAFGLARQLAIPQSEAKAYITRYFERFPGIRTYMDDTVAACREQGYVSTLFGRRVHIRSIHDKNPALRQFGERAAINAPIQGSAADIIRRAMVRMPGALSGAGLRTRMLLQVHDELVFEVPERELEDARRTVQDVMEGAAAPAVNLSVPLTVGVGVGDNWDEAH
ncbi:DNA polymerase I [Iodidimonas sp. SYSU 1G8]|uniref:DNA polymerase I n=1 Tax=Iodidimonas sp. SYSU 1G8 TaxID=3133967 RepID=UPI0031FE4A24